MFGENVATEATGTAREIAANWFPPDCEDYGELVEQIESALLAAERRAIQRTNYWQECAEKAQSELTQHRQTVEAMRRALENLANAVFASGLNADNMEAWLAARRPLPSSDSR